MSLPLLFAAGVFLQLFEATPDPLATTIVRALCSLGMSLSLEVAVLGGQHAPRKFVQSAGSTAWLWHYDPPGAEGDLATRADHPRSRTSSPGSHSTR